MLTVDSAEYSIGKQVNDWNCDEIIPKSQNQNLHIIYVAFQIQLNFISVKNSREKKSSRVNQILFDQLERWLLFHLFRVSHTHPTFLKLFWFRR